MRKVLIKLNWSKDKHSKKHLQWPLSTLELENEVDSSIWGIYIVCYFDIITKYDLIEDGYIQESIISLRTNPDLLKHKSSFPRFITWAEIDKTISKKAVLYIRHKLHLPLGVSELSPDDDLMSVSMPECL